jgi:hypothetical protein
MTNGANLSSMFKKPAGLFGPVIKIGSGTK